jgi:tRNA1(Val) A37 N6-methylase TrmN6
MAWTPDEVRLLQPIVDRLARDLGRPLDLVVAGSGYGEVAFELARRFPHARIVGFELDPKALEEPRRHAAALGLQERVEFLAANVSETCARPAAATSLA